MRPETAELVERIRRSDRYLADLTCVAVADDDQLVGFVMLSRLDVHGEASWSALALAPLAIKESHQGLGIGTALTKYALGRADRLGEAAVVVLGHPGYYPRLGFVSASAIGILPPSEASIPDEAWMVMPLSRYSVHMRGTVSYSADFIETRSVPGM